MKVTKLELSGTFDEFDQLQSAMFDEGNQIGAMQIRMITNGGKTTIGFIGGGNVIRLAQSLGMLDMEPAPAADAGADRGECG